MSIRVYVLVAAMCMVAGAAGSRLEDVTLRMYPPIETVSDEIVAAIADGLNVEPARPASDVPIDEDRDLFLEFVSIEMIRLGLTKKFASGENAIRRFLEFVKLIESNGDPFARAGTTTAMSLFQFTRGSVPTAVNRLENYMLRHGYQAIPVWASMLRENPKLLFHVPEQRQAILTLVNIIEQRGSDELLREFLNGEREVAKAIYYAHHHTDPDQATLRRTEKIFAKVFN